MSELARNCAALADGFRRLFALGDRRKLKTCERFLSLGLQDWKEESVRDSAECLSRLILEPDLMQIIALCFPQYVLEILTMTLSSDASHPLKCVLLGKLVHRHPDVLKCSLVYFKHSAPPWSIVDVDGQKAKKRKVLQTSVTDLDIVECCWSLLLASFETFKNMWNWSDLIFKYLSHDNRQVVWVTSQCTALVLCMNEHQRESFIAETFTADEIKQFTLLYDKNDITASFDFDVLHNSDKAVKESETVSHSTAVVSISQNVVNVGGISLPVFSHKNKSASGFLVPVKSTLSNLRNVAVGIATNKTVCLTGPVGCGKTALVEHLAQITGRTNTNGFLKVQLGEETDSKMLLGSYRCTDIPGEFIWLPGVLTKAVLDGYWLLLEDIDSAASDVAAVLAGLLENNSLSIPGFRDNVRASPGFQLFVTHRLISSLGGNYKRHTTAVELLEKHWLRINCEPLTREELVFIIQQKFPLLRTIASKMVAVYMLFSLGNHEDSSGSIAFPSSGRLTSTRDLLKWCTRAQIDFTVTSQETALKVFQDAIDVFCCSNSNSDERLELARKIAASLGIITTKAEYFCQLHKPSINLTLNDCKMGRVTLKKKSSSGISLLESETSKIKFAFTLGSCSLLERIAMCISLCEPVLLVGETGTGKTSTLQLLAKHTGHTLVVINMNQQSDSADLLGGYKPVDLKFIISPIRDEFEKLFRSFFKVQENLKFLEHISVCFSNRKWPVLLKLMRHSQAAAVKRLSDTSDSSSAEKLNQWRKLGEKIIKLQSQLSQGQMAMAFSFIEGSLIRAIREGYWVLLDEINLASAETLQCLSGLLEGNTDSIFLLEKGEDALVKKHPEFRLMAAMNPATDVGKKDLPSGIRNRFTELFVFEHTAKGDLRLVVSCYLPELNATKVEAVVNFYLSVREKAKTSLSDATGHRPHYSLRTLCRALLVAATNLCGSVQRSLYEALCLSFLTQLDTVSHRTVQKMIAKTVMEEGDIKCVVKKTIPEPLPTGRHVCFEGYWVPKGEKEPHIPEKYLITPSVRRNLSDLARCVSLSSHPVLIQGETSVGKTSLITYLAQASGHTCLRINNHQHTDLQEYVGSYSADPVTGSLVFQEGVLVECMRNGYWIILDELNLAPCEVLEALNRVLDDNRELYIAETQRTVKAHPNFRLFATQNPPGLYGGRKMLSRAFRNRFVELHFDEIPPPELENILQHRCQMPMSYCKKLVVVMTDLQVRRKISAAFAGKQGFITLRDLFRWGERYRLANQLDPKGFYDWDQHLADEGYLVLAGRVRKEEECETIRQVIEKRIKRKVDVEKLFTLNAETSAVTKHLLQRLVENQLPEGFSHIVWTLNLRKLAVFTGKALEFHEPVLLVGETGCGKTTVSQLLTVLSNQQLYSINCHQHSESSDFLGGLRPVREREDTSRLFEWVDGPLIEAMRTGQVFLADEISLADDSVLERLNSLLEPERKLLISEKGSGEELEVTAHENFHFIGTMNPGGDFGKKELSPALRNRFTEIWCEGANYKDIISIMEHNIRSGLSLGNQEDGSSGIGKALVQFVQWFTSTDIGKRITVSIRDILTWVKFINIVTEESNTLSFPSLEVSSAYVHGGCLTVIDGIGSATTSSDNTTILNEFKRECLKYLLAQVNAACGSHCIDLDILLSPSKANLKVVSDQKHFGVHPFYIHKGLAPAPLKQDFMFDAPTTCINALRVLRSLQIPSRAILLEGSPGVGKTSLVTALAKASGYPVTRINLSEQTDVSDLFGADLPVEGAPGGVFAWRDGPFLKALRNGHWILLDELNLASQSVVEGLNSVLDHRGEIFVPELGRTFHLQRDTTRIFACQNPQRQGGARKGLPQSFLNRFTQVFMEVLTKDDLKLILSSLYPNLSVDVVEKMVEFNMKLTETRFSSGTHWEWNLRDLSFWAETIEDNDPGTFMCSIYAGRMRNTEDKAQVISLYETIFGSEYPLVKRTSPLVVTSTNVRVGEVTLSRTPNESSTLSQDAIVNAVDKHSELLVLRSQLAPLASLSLCASKKWMAILVGNSHSGKTSLVHVLAQLACQKLYTLSVNSAMDTTELLGGFEQTDYSRHLEEISDKVESVVVGRVQKLMLANQKTDAQELLSRWYNYTSLKSDGGDSEYTLSKATDLFLRRLDLLYKVLDSIAQSEGPVPTLKTKLGALKSCVEKQGLKAGGTFEWVDSVLVKCLLDGYWLLIDNVNLCSGSVLDRLNGLLEPNGVLLLGERGVGPEGELVIKPHPNFRLFLAMDPHHGDISRAMRNRGIEIYVEPLEINSMHILDLNAVLSQAGLVLQEHRNAVINIHKRMLSVSHGINQPSTSHLLHASFIAVQNWKRGLPLYQSIHTAFFDIYLKSRTLMADHKLLVVNTLEEAIQDQKDMLSLQYVFVPNDFFSKYSTISTLPLQENSMYSMIKHQGALLNSFIKSCKMSEKMDKSVSSLTIRDIVGSDFTDLSMKLSIGLEYRILEIIPFIVVAFYHMASSADITLRHLWLTNILKTDSKDPTMKNVFIKIEAISELVSQTLLQLLNNHKTPWDLRYYSDKAEIVSEQRLNSVSDWSPENKLSALIYYKLVMNSLSMDDEVILDVKPNWKTMSVNQYSEMVKKGEILDLITDHPLICKLTTLASEFDEAVLSMLSSKTTGLSTEQCSKFLYNVAWRFRLSNVGKRHLFDSSSSSNLPNISEDTRTLLLLHYKWFNKYTLPLIIEIMTPYPEMKKTMAQLLSVIEKINSSLGGSDVQLITLARRMTRKMSQPIPLSSTLQCDLSKQLKRLIKVFGIWKDSHQNITEDKLNLFATSEGLSMRNKLVKASQIIFENMHLDEATIILSEVEQFTNQLSDSSSTPKEIKDHKVVTAVKFAPVSELLCLLLNTACRKQIALGQTGSSYIMESLKNMIQWSTSVSPITAGILCNVCNTKAYKDVMKVNVMLMNHMNYSLAVNNPYEWMLWRDQNNDTKAMDTSENKMVVYPLHCPLFSLFISGSVARSNRKEDNCSSALNSFGDTNKLMNLLKQTLWRNMPAIFSDVLNVSLNEEQCLRVTFEKLVTLLSEHTDVKFQNKDTSKVNQIICALRCFVKSRSSGYCIGQVVNSLTELESTIGNLDVCSDDTEKWLLIGKGWILMGHIHAIIFANLEPVDPVQKKALKKQYTLEEVDELEKLLCIEEINKAILGESGKWPFETSHQSRIQFLKDRTNNLQRTVAVRPCPPLYNDIVKDVIHLTRMASENALKPLLSDLCNSEFDKQKIERSLTETKVMLDSFKRYNDKLVDSYLVTYPDIVTPPLLALSQLIHGFHLMGSAVQKKHYQSEFSSAQLIMEYLSIFPIPDVDCALKIVDECTSPRILELIDKANELMKTSFNTDHAFKLTRISMHITKGIAGSTKWVKTKDSFLNVLSNFIKSWQKHQVMLEEKKAQEESIYINKMSDVPLTEEEIISEEITELFPSSHDCDFGDLAPPTLDSQPELKKPKLNQEITMSRLTSQEIDEICDLHSAIVKETTKAHWLFDSIVTNKRDDYLLAFLDRINIFTCLIDRLYIACDKRLDRVAIAGLYMATGIPIEEISPEEPDKNYDFYRDSNVDETRKCIPLLNALMVRVTELLSEWPEHPTLNQIQVIVDRIKGFSFKSPLSRFLTGMELLLTKLHEWEENAHDGVSLATMSATLTTHIIAWRRLELSAWKGSLHGTAMKIRRNANKWWFHLYALINEHLNKENDPGSNETFISALEAFMESSTLGEFSRRLEFLYAFHCHCVSLKSSPRQQELSDIFWNLYNYYNQFSSLLARRIKELSAKIEKELKDFVKIARWNDINYWSVKAAVEKTHRTLHKHIKAFEKILNQPANTAMTKVQDVPKKTESLACNYNLYMSNLINNMIPDDGMSVENPLTKQTALFKRARSLCKKVMIKCPYPSLIEGLYKFNEDISEIGKLLNDFEINPALPAEKKRSAAKNLLQKKRKAVSDMFKTLAELGLAYRSGLLVYESKNIDFATHKPINVKAALKQIESRPCDNEWLTAWEDVDSHFWASISRMAQLKVGLQKPHKDLGPPCIERVKGFTSHLMKTCYEQKLLLQNSSQELYVLRCLVVQMNKFKDMENAVDTSEFMNNKAALIDVLDDIIYSVDQFTLVLEACPGQLNEVETIPTIFSDHLSNSDMVMSLKNDINWESVKNFVDKILDSSRKLRSHIYKTESHSLFIKHVWNQNLSNVENFNILDSLVNYEQFENLKKGLVELKIIKENICEIQRQFRVQIEGAVIMNPLTDCLYHLEKKIDNVIDKISKLSSIPVNTDESHNEIFESKAESLLNSILYIIQEIYKKYFAQLEHFEEPEHDSKIEKEDESDLDIKEGHLKHLLNKNLNCDLDDLKLKQITIDMVDLIKIISNITSRSTKLSVQRYLQLCTPLFDQFILLSQFFITQQTASLKVTSIVCSNLLKVFANFALSGYNIPEELQDELEGEGEETKGGMGLGEGEGEKDVSDQIESQDQLEEARKPDEYGQDEDKDCKEEEKGIEMSDDFGGKLQDIEKNEDDEKSEGEKSDTEEPDKEMGDTEKGTEALDQQIWGEDSDEEEQTPKDEMPFDESHDKGAGQEEPEMGAKDDSKAPQDTNETDPQRKEQKKDTEINEMEERDIEDEHNDPYHGNMEPLPEPEPFELEDNLNLDQESMGSDSEDEKDTENPFEKDISKEMKQDEEEKPNDEKEGKQPENQMEENTENNEESDDEGQTVEPGQEKQDENLETPNEQEGDTEKGNADEKNDPVEEEDDSEEAGASSVDKPSQDVVEGSDKQQSCQDQVAQDPSQDSTEASERNTNAEGKDEQGIGQAEEEKCEMGGHQGNVGKGTSQGTKKREEKRERPGQSEIERSLGEVNEPVKKRLKTIGISKEQEEQDSKMDEELTENKDEGADLYQHIHEAKQTQHDELTVDAATKEQAEKQPVPPKEEDENVEPMTEEDQPMDLAEDDIVEEIDVPKVEPDSLKEADRERSKDKSKQNADGEIKEDTGVEVEGEFVPTATVERGHDSTYHTRPEEMKIDFTLINDEDVANIRQELEQQLASWNQPPANAEAMSAWEKLCQVTSGLARDLSEQLRLVLEPTTASSLKGDFRTGRRINMRKVIPYIASQFRKDKIWLRRTKPSKREYQIVLAVDDSSSMADNHSKELAFESLALVSRALSLLEAGDLAVLSFGETVQVLHKLGESFTEHSGARLLQQFSFEQKRTKIGALVDFASTLLSSNVRRSVGSDLAQLLVIVSDGRGVLSEGEASVRAAVRRAKHQQIFMVFVIIDNPDSKDSILDIRMPQFKDGKLTRISSYMDHFPFPFYLILRDINNLPTVLSDALRQWFELVTNLH